MKASNRPLSEWHEQHHSFWSITEVLQNKLYLLQVLSSFYCFSPEKCMPDDDVVIDDDDDDAF